MPNFTGGPGDDVFTGTDGHETIQSLDGNDTLDGAEGNDVILAGFGDDKVFGGGSRDHLYGNGGADTIHGGDDDDTLYSGDWTEDPGIEIDRLNGGNGDDWIYGGIGDRLDGGADFDWLFVFFTGSTVGITANFARLLNGNAMVVGGTMMRNFEFLAAVFGSDYDDNLTLGIADNVPPSAVRFLQGPSAYGGFGDDRITGSAASERIFGDEGGESVPDGDDILSGGAGDDKLYGNGGADRLIGGSGNDAMFGGTGNDSYDVRDVGDTVTESEDQGSADVVRAFIDFTLGANVERLELFGEARVGTGNELANIIFGTDAGDTISGLDGSDILRGNGARDTIDGGAGDDLIDGGAGRDTLTGGTGRDTFQFRDGDTIGSRANGDVITDFDQAANEIIQFALVDANSAVAGDQAFEWIGTAGFSGTAGELRYVQASGNTFIEGDLDGDGLSDYTIQLTGFYTLDTSDFTGVADLFP